MKYFLIFVCVVSLEIPNCLSGPTKRASVSYLDSVLRSKPKANLFLEENHSGVKIPFQQADLLELDGCYFNLLQRRNGKSVKSVAPLGTCLRLFEAPFCSGRSLAVYPGSPNLNNLQSPELNFKVKSLGPCLENEFDKAKVIKNNGKQLIVKDAALVKSYDSVPDLLEFDGTSTLSIEDAVIRPVEVYPGEFYFHGMKGQKLIFVWARINSTMHPQVFFEKLQSSLHDGVSPGVQGSGKVGAVAKTSFELSFALKISEVMWSIDTKADDEIDLFVNFIYENESDAMPRACSYSIQSDSVIKYGLVQVQIP